MEIKEVQMNESMNIALFLTVFITTHFVTTEGGAKIAKCTATIATIRSQSTCICLKMNYDNLYQEPISPFSGYGLLFVYSSKASTQMRAKSNKQM